jgi:hypothetical protein
MDKNRSGSDGNLGEASVSIDRIKMDVQFSDNLHLQKGSHMIGTLFVEAVFLSHGGMIPQYG